MKLLDSHGRLWFSGYMVGLADNPEEVVHLVRLLSDGTIDPDFFIGRIEADYPVGWSVPPALISEIIEPDLQDEVYFLSGVFSHYNDTAQPAITAINDQGYIQNNYFGNQGSTVNSFDPDDPTDYDAPAIRAMEQLPDGSLMVGGSFSDFMGVERYSLVKLNQGTLSTIDQAGSKRQLTIYPNPARDFIRVQPYGLQDTQIETLQIVDLSGRIVAEHQWGNGVFDVKGLANGLYLVHVFQDEKPVGSEKLVVYH